MIRVQQLQFMRNSIVIRTEFRFIFFFQLRDVAHGFYDISSLYRIVILIGKADIEEVGLTVDFAAYDTIFRQSLIPRKTHSKDFHHLDARHFLSCTV